MSTVQEPGADAPDPAALPTPVDALPAPLLDALPAPVPTPLLRRAGAPVRFATRLGLLSAHALHGQRIVRHAFPQLDAQGKQQRIRDWSARLLQLAGIELKVSGAPLQTPSLVVANHVSWIDIFAINAVQPVRFVSKSEAAQWPLIGPLVRDVGTLFIERERAQDVVRIIHQMAQCLQAGDHVGVFPEGTTSYGHGLLPFHANLFQAACTTGNPAPVQPIVLFYADQRSGRFSQAASYVGDETMVGSLWRMSAAPALRVEIDYLPPLRATTRRALTQQSRDAIAEHLHQRLRNSR